MYGEFDKNRETCATSLFESDFAFLSFFLAAAGTLYFMNHVFKIHPYNLLIVNDNYHVYHPGALITILGKSEILFWMISEM